MPNSKRNIFQPTLREETLAELVPFGYGPGGYMGKCPDCGEEFIGAKRSPRCADCAILIAVKVASAVQGLGDE